MMRFGVTTSLAAGALFGMAAVASAQDDPGGMMAAQGCMMLEASGAAEVTIDGETKQGAAVYQSGPNGEAFVVIGELTGPKEPAWCLSIMSAVPVGDNSLQVASPEQTVQTRDGVMVVMAETTQGDDERSYFAASGGIVRYRSGDILEGRLDVQGSLENAGGQAEISITGWFEAVPLN